MNRAATAVAVILALGAAGCASENGTMVRERDVARPRPSDILKAHRAEKAEPSTPAAPPGRRYPGSWTRGPGMPTATVAAAAATVGGRFYSLGGTPPTTQMYDPATGAWSTLAPPPVFRAYTQATAVGTVIYVYGGCISADCSFLASDTWAYDTAADTWTQKAPMPGPRQGLSSDVIGGKIYVAGGYSGGAFTNYTPSLPVTVFDPAADAWTTKAPMPLGRGYGAAGAVNGILYYAGGSATGFGGAPHADVMAYDPAADSWTMRAPLPAPLLYAGGAAYGGRFYVVGGSTVTAASVFTSATWVYDPSANAWSAGPALNDARYFPMTAAGGGTLFVSGSTNGTYSTSFEYATIKGASPANRRIASNEAAPRGPAPAADVAAPASDVDNPSRRAAARPGDYALVIGIEQYSRLPEARYAENDADAMKKHLLALGYPERNIILLKGSQATHSTMQGYVEEWLPKNVKPDSEVFVYFSGHGSPDPKTGDAYLVPWDGDAMFLKSTAYPLKSLYASLGQLKAKRVLVALDSCFSGAGGRSVLASGARPLVSHVDDTAAPAGVTVLSAASGDEITGTIDDQGHGAFTYYLLKAFNDGKLTAKSAYDELKPGVQDEAHRQNREQTPLMLGEDARF